MKKKSLFLMGMLAVTGLLLSGCRTSGSSKSGKSSTTEVVAKTAAKAALRRSPIAIIKAVK